MSGQQVQRIDSWEVTRFGLSLLISGVALVWSEKPVWSKVPTFDRSPVVEQVANLSPVTDSQKSFARLAQMPSLVQIKDVRIESTANSLQVTIETTDGKILVPESRVEGKILTIELPNAQLNLANPATASQSNPIAGIEAISVTALPNNRVRVSISGTIAAPIAEIQTSEQKLVVNVTPSNQTAADPELEITVTGGRKKDGYNPTRSSITRSDTSLQEIPQSVQVIPPQVIQDRQSKNIVESLRIIPGIVSEEAERSVFTSANPRGFTTSFAVDGLRDPGIAFSGGSNSNIERIEILKGPASILFGQSSFGGTINLVTKQPKKEPYYAIEGTVGNFGLFGGAIDMSGPLNPDKTLRYRLNVLGETGNSFVDFLGVNRFEVSPTVTWELSKNTDITIEGKYISANIPFDTGLPAKGTILPNINGRIPLNRFLGDPDLNEEKINYFQIGYSLNHRFSEDWQIRNAFRYGSRLSTQSVTIPQSLLADERTLETIYLDQRNQPGKNDTYNLDTYTVGKFNTGTIKHELTAGIDLSRNVSSGRNFEGSQSPIDIFSPDYSAIVQLAPTVFDSRSTNDGLGVYVQNKVNLQDNLILVLGGRFDVVNTKFEDFEASTSESQQNQAFSPRVGLVYKPIPDLSLYASYSNSFQQSVGRLASGGVFEPERGTQYEIGAKAEIGKKLSATIALFDITRSNVPTADPENLNFSIQTGEQNSRGAELFVTGEISPGWNVIGGYSYTDARITKDNTLVVGNRLNNVPQHAASLWTTYEIQQGSMKGLGAGLGLFSVGERQGDLENTFTLPSYLRTDASVFYKKEGFRATLSLKNLFGITYFPSAQNDLRVRVGDPFTIAGSVSFEF
jgi:iron complex outermembrane recepter protein